MHTLLFIHQVLPVVSHQWPQLVGCQAALQAINIKAVTRLTQSLVITTCQHNYTPILLPHAILQRSLDAELSRMAHTKTTKRKARAPQKEATPSEEESSTTQPESSSEDEGPPPSQATSSFHPKSQKRKLSTDTKEGKLPARKAKRKEKKKDKKASEKLISKDDQLANIDEDAAHRKQAR